MGNLWIESKKLLIVVFWANVILICVRYSNHIGLCSLTNALIWLIMLIRLIWNIGLLRSLLRSISFFNSIDNARQVDLAWYESIINLFVYVCSIINIINFLVMYLMSQNIWRMSQRIWYITKILDVIPLKLLQHGSEMITTRKWKLSTQEWHYRHGLYHTVSIKSNKFPNFGHWCTHTKSQSL